MQKDLFVSISIASWFCWYCAVSDSNLTYWCHISHYLPLVVNLMGHLGQYSFVPSQFVSLSRDTFFQVLVFVCIFFSGCSHRKCRSYASWLFPGYLINNISYAAWCCCRASCCSAGRYASLFVTLCRIFRLLNKLVCMFQNWLAWGLKSYKEILDGMLQQWIHWSIQQ